MGALLYLAALSVMLLRKNAVAIAVPAEVEVRL
jgi:hypothetical protein